MPHNYYYREMYLPQATSGVGSPTWSPDGREIAVSMEGSLWTIDPATGVARQLTNGPGYDYQPDWSPDGRLLAYASYRDDAVELRAYEFATGRTWPLTENAAVNVEPRWSPDGRSLAFVSTAHEGRFHVYRLEAPGGRPGSLVRLTEDKDSGLPRYYYSRFDHYLSPAWSPDGSELLLVSNRGRIWGTGGVWRMKAEPGAPMRLLHYEETSWKARPDWSPDGRRAVYASYLGRQWHQLWLMTAEGGDVFPLTYGDFDATAPRWSRDGGRIAYVSNEDGIPALWVIDVPGGRTAEGIDTGAAIPGAGGQATDRGLGERDSPSGACVRDWSRRTQLTRRKAHGVTPTTSSTARSGRSSTGTSTARATPRSSCPRER